MREANERTTSWIINNNAPQYIIESSLQKDWGSLCDGYNLKLLCHPTRELGDFYVARVVMFKGRRLPR